MNIKKGVMFALFLSYFWRSAPAAATTPAPILDHSDAFKRWTKTRPSMQTTFQGTSWVDWVLLKQTFVGIHLFTHFDIPEIQTEHARKTNSFARNLFYTHGLLLFNRSMTDTVTCLPQIDVDSWISRKLHPHDVLQKDTWIVAVRNPALVSKDMKPMKQVHHYTLPKHWACNQVAHHLASLNIENFIHHPGNYTCEPVLDLYVSNTAFKTRPEPDRSTVYYIAIDVGTTKCSTPTQPETVLLKDAAWILFNRKGQEITRQTIQFSTQQPVTSYLFFIELASVIAHYQAEIVAYNGAFDAIVLSRWCYNPVVSYMLSVWNHDVMYMAMNYQKADRVCGLETAYKNILHKEFGKKWHVSINDCEGTKELFLYLMNLVQ